MHGLLVEHKMLQSLKLFEQFIMFALKTIWILEHARSWVFALGMVSL